MVVFGIEFTSGFAQVLYTLVLLVLGGSAVWLFRRLRQNEKLLVVVRRENSKLRHEVANVTGWTANGRLPEDWPEKLRAETAAAAGYTGSSVLETLREPMLPPPTRLLLQLRRRFSPQATAPTTLTVRTNGSPT
jgi:hypothetical protein